MNSKEQNNSSTEIAIVGMACRLPGGINNPKEFWELLIENKIAIEKTPASRWSIKEYYSGKNEPGKISSPDGGFIDNIKNFDPLFFRISPKEAIEMDPQQRILMEVAWEAIENSGTSPKFIKNTDVGVFIGIRSSEYHNLCCREDKNNTNIYTATGSQLSAASGRLSYFFGFNGPSLSIDTACSSSMTALHYACESIKNNDSESAIVGGVNVMLSPESSVATSQGYMLSPSGLCKTFSETADGYVRSEGCVVLFLKSLEKAQNEGDQILAVVKSTGVNQDGASGGLTVPYGLAQMKLLKRTLNKAQLLPKEIDYVEAHGTGTALGDPIEVLALNKIIGLSHSKDIPLRIGSVKSNIGHTESTAGLAGVMKTILALNNELIPASLNSDPPNTSVNWNAMSLKVVNENEPWLKSKKIRYAGISSFGFTGTNAHVIIKEAPNKNQLAFRDTNIFCLFVCSAKTEEALKDMLDNYISFLEKPNLITLNDICYTSLIGRNHFKYKVAVVTNSKSNLLNTLNNILSNKGFYKKTKTHENQKDLALDLSGFNLVDDKMRSLLTKEHPFFKQTLKIGNLQIAKYLESNNSLRNPKLENLNTINANARDLNILYSTIKTWLFWGVSLDVIVVDLNFSNILLAACISDVFTFSTMIELLYVKFFFNIGLINEQELLINLKKIEFNSPSIDLVNVNNGALINNLDLMSVEFWKNLVVGGLNFINRENKKINSFIFLNLEHVDKSNPHMNILQELRFLFLKGYDINWLGFFQGQKNQKVILPNYPFQRKEYWIASAFENK